MENGDDILRNFEHLRSGNGSIGFGLSPCFPRPCPDLLILFRHLCLEITYMHLTRIWRVLYSLPGLQFLSWDSVISYGKLLPKPKGVLLIFRRVPIQTCFGRRPVLIFSSLICFGSSIWRAKATTYNSFMGACVYVKFDVHESGASRLTILIGLMESVLDQLKQHNLQLSQMSSSCMIEESIKLYTSPFTSGRLWYIHSCSISQ